MALVLKSPQIHSTFSNLGFMHADGYHVNENCNAALENILHNILTEDKYLRAYRRSINFGKNIQKDLIPLLIHAKEDKTIELLVTILVNLSIPIECLLSVEVTSQSNNGLHTVFEINQLLTAIKAAFTEPRATKVVVDFLKKNVVPQPKVSQEQCTNISNGLLLLRNILHIPEGVDSSPGKAGSNHPVLNQILWNVFSQSIDVVLIQLMTVPEATNWAVTMVQLVALLYKDQDVATLQNLLKEWLESCGSESSEDNESNTSLPNRGSENSSPMLTSAPTSDSSDTGGSGKSNEDPNCEKNGWGASSENPTLEDATRPRQPASPAEADAHMRDHDAPPGATDDHMHSDSDDKVVSEVPPTATATTNDQQPEKTEKKAVISETSDFGYGTQIENQESSSNDDDLPSKKPVHQKPHKLKQKVNTKVRTGVTSQETRRKKITKGGKANISSINVQGLAHQTPTDTDISNLLKEFAIEFLRKGYNSLVQTLHSQILTNVQLEIDTSHFFWLLTYFLKFVTQIELDLEQISAVLSFDIVSYLTAEGVNACEQLELAGKLDSQQLKPSGRRLHLVVTALREFVQALEAYKMFPHICAEDKDGLLMLQDKMCETDELRSLLVLLLRHYNPKYHTKQYLQDLIITNHILLKFVDSGLRNMKRAGAGRTSMADHIKQFATPLVMRHYGAALAGFAANDFALNDCVLTLMHHVAGQPGCLPTLYEPNILKTFASIKTSGFEICDDWSDLIEYVINTFILIPNELLSIDNFRMDTQVFDDVKFLTELAAAKPARAAARPAPAPAPAPGSASQASDQRWSEEELSSLRWIYLQCNTLPDAVCEILKCLKEEGTVKTRDSVVRELHKKNIINKEEYEKLSKAEVQSRHSKKTQLSKEIRDVEIGKLCEQLRLDGKTKGLEWVQQVLLEICYAKLEVEKRHLNECCTSEDRPGDLKLKIFNQELNSPVMSPVSYRALLLNESVPLVPWNSEQAAMCKNLYFLQLLYKLGFQMPVDSGKVFLRIPHAWPARRLYAVAGRLAAVDTTKLKFSISDLTSSSSESTWQQCNSALPADLAKDVTSLISAPGSSSHRHLAAAGNFTPRAGSSCRGDAPPAGGDRAPPAGGDRAPPAGGGRCWLEVVQQSQQLKLTYTVGSVLEDVTELTEAAPAPGRPPPWDFGAQQEMTEAALAPGRPPPWDFGAQQEMTEAALAPGRPPPRYFGAQQETTKAAPAPGRPPPRDFGAQLEELPEAAPAPGRPPPRYFGAQQETTKAAPAPGRPPPRDFGAQLEELPEAAPAPGRPPPRDFGAQLEELPEAALAPGRPPPRYFGAQQETTKAAPAPGRPPPRDFGAQLEELPEAAPAPGRPPPRDFGAQQEEMDDDNSVSDTASVDSDLTRMHVSDEDEKMELAFRPSVIKSHRCATRAARDRGPNGGIMSKERKGGPH